MSDQNPNAFKHWMGPELVRKIGRSVKLAYPDFNREKFEQVAHELAPLELKPRVRLIRTRLKECLPADYGDALRIICQSAKDPSLQGFDLWPFTDFVENHGLENVDASLEALRELTKKFTSEFAVRPFLVKYPTYTLRRLKSWVPDPNVHVRRWISEGTRPRLPWGLRLNSFVESPELTLPLLEKLKYDEELYVRKSVANHLNDIAKDHPDLVVKTLMKWRRGCPARHKEKLDWITRHALRFLVKQGHREALKCLGYNCDVDVKIGAIRLEKKIYRVGDEMRFSFFVQNGSADRQRLMIDYVIHYQRANDQLSPKVFKLKTILLSSGQKVEIAKKHSLKPVTTRKYYPGEHRLEIQINGRIMGSIKWILK